MSTYKQYVTPWLLALLFVVCCYITLLKESTPAMQQLDPLIERMPEVYSQSGCSIKTPYTLEHIRELYHRFAADLVVMRQRARAFCLVPKPEKFRNFHRCSYSTVEMELLYLWIREQRPTKVLELCSAVGYTTQWVLWALEDNGHGELWGADASDSLLALTSTGLPQPVLDRFHFKRAFFSHEQFLEYASKHDFDRIIIDGDHTAEWAAFFAPKILERQARRTGHLEVSVHDMFKVNLPNHDVSGEGRVVGEWLTNLALPHSCLLLNPKHNNNLLKAVHDVRRGALGVAELDNPVYAPKRGTVPDWMAERTDECTLFTTITNPK